MRKQPAPRMWRTSFWLPWSRCCAWCTVRWSSFWGRGHPDTADGVEDAGWKSRAAPHDKMQGPTEARVSTTPTARWKQLSAVGAGADAVWGERQPSAARRGGRRRSPPVHGVPEADAQIGDPSLLWW